MHGGHNKGREAGFHEFTSLLGDSKRAAQQSLRRRRSQAHHHLRIHHRKLGRQPRLAGRDLEGVRRRVDPPLAAGAELEVSPERLVLVSALGSATAFRPDSNSLTNSPLSLTIHGSRV